MLKMLTSTNGCCQKMSSVEKENKKMINKLFMCLSYGTDWSKCISSDKLCLSKHEGNLVLL